ncbi:DNA-(apurinic or apyrimidinic site) lyase 2 isoform X2 [Asparagus officinalis]|nr:DNA-(apurinic or apyrimidinic site) lyase 2 isoform X2 [Asparagus officinalis]
MAAEEGFTGTLHGLKKKEMMVGEFEVELPLNVEGLEDVTNEDLLKVDSEGRCVITDHGHFVLFNLYGPRAQEEDRERIQFKLLFFKVLQKRWQSLLSQGRSIIVVGDLNIAPATMDRCDAEPGFEKDMFRKWLRSLLRDSGGPFFDVFRSKHPARREAYTCFSPRVGAEEFNYGSRIDHILIAGPCLHKENDLEGHNLFNCHAEACDIMVQFKRGKPENTPKWQGGRTIKLDGSDHIPVYAVLSNMPNLSVHNTPPLAVRYIPEVRGWQQTIVSFLGKREKHCFKHPTVPNCQSDENTETQDSWKCALNADNEPTSNVEMAVGSSHFSFHQRLSDSVLEAQRTGSSLSDNSDVLKENDDMVLSKLRKDQSLYRSSTVVMKKGRRSAYSQLTLKSFFKQPKAANSFDTANAKAPQVQADWQEENENMFHKTESSCDKRLPENIEENSSELTVPITDACGQDLSFSSKMEKGNAVLEWQKIQEKMRTSIPLCKGHHEPCVARSVKKGSNVGRRFYVCARAKGPESEPEANCNYFQWAPSRSKQKRN